MCNAIKVSGLVEESIVDGPGIRFVIFTQGCPHHCNGCHNPETHDYNGGYTISHNEIIEKIKKNPLLDGVTFSGGEPFIQAESCSILAEKIKCMGLTVLTYSGYTFEEILNNKNFKKFLENTDILIDGKFEITKKSMNIKFRGSTNQRIIDVKKSLECNNITIYKI